MEALMSFPPLKVATQDRLVARRVPKPLEVGRI